LPRDLGDGLVLRYATGADAEPLAQFSVYRAHGYRPGPKVHPRLLDADDPRDRKLWKEE